MSKSYTPMMQQYFDVKDKYQDCLLFFRLGDFYELFFDDAKVASSALDLMLTGRDCGLPDRAPMCGVPYHAVDNYVARLIKQGHKVAICEQLQDPSLAVGLVERDVVRVITPGTVTAENMLEERSNSFIASLFFQDDSIGIAYADVTTGGFFVTESREASWPSFMCDELYRIQPGEIIVNDALMLREAEMRPVRQLYYTEAYDAAAFAFENARERLLNHFGITSLMSFGCEKLEPGICAAGALMRYLEETQKISLTHIKALKLVMRNQFMFLDATARRNLELTRPLAQDGSKKSTLLGLLDKTCTAMGGRMLRSWVESPLQSVTQINGRLSAVDELVREPIGCEALKTALSGINDIERLAGKIAYGSVNARDCVALENSLARLPELVNAISALSGDRFVEIKKSIDPMEDIYGLLASAIADEPPIGVKDGGIIRPGYNEELDGYRDAQTNGRAYLAEMEAKERAETGIKGLKIGFNRVFGYYIEVTKSFLSLVPYGYQRKQTLANCERFVTAELKELEDKILGAEEKAISLEYKLFIEIREALGSCISRLQENAALISELDCYRSLAAVAYANDYCRPIMTEKGALDIKGGRHPVVEQTRREGFIPNDTYLDDDDRLVILTGPNMAGKSTYMRQVALITLMSHIGSFVPAKSASIPIVDRIFTRVGASDNLAGGQSTFMVEMSEVSAILNNATDRSLLILDEIGRGTSTFDGLSIAWAVLEHIADRKKLGAKTLFATHYHELTELESKLEGVKNYRISVKEVGEGIIFLRRIVRGGADKSFGVQVARLAGLPDDVLKRAKEILRMLEEADLNRQIRGTGEPKPDVTEQLSLFEDGGTAKIIDELRAVDIDSITPMEALNKLYELSIRARRT